jgi:hypothetical protein
VKTSIDLPESLLREVKQLARERGVTTRSLVEQALIRLIEDAAAKPVERFVLADLSVPGALSVEFAEPSWPQLREEIYGGR